MPPHKRNIGMVFQNYALFPHMNVFHNIAFPLKMRGVDVRDVHSSAYPKLLELLPKAGARPANARIAQDDSSALGGFATRHPDVARITSI